MNQESITFYSNLFDKLVVQKQKDYPNLTHQKYYEQTILKNIKLHFQHQEIIVTFDLRAADAILNSLKSPKMMHYGEKEHYLNPKRLTYLKIAQILYQKKMIDRRHCQIIKDEINKKSNYLLNRLQNFIHFNKVSGQNRIKENWQLSMQMSFQQFWQAIKANEFLFSPLEQIFEITGNYLNIQTLKIADQCIMEMVKKKSKIQSKPKRQKNHNRLDITYLLQDIQVIRIEDKPEDVVSQRKLLTYLQQ